jgi:hypothetical protein
MNIKAVAFAHAPVVLTEQAEGMDIAECPIR